MERKKKLELSLNNRQSAFLLLWNKLEDGRLPHGAIGEVAEFFSVDRSTISKLWRALKNKIDNAVNNPNGEEVDQTLSFEFNKMVPLHISIQTTSY
jgi:hypothetical protein